jgi:hypothetical protein
MCTLSNILECGGLLRLRTTKMGKSIEIDKSPTRLNQWLKRKGPTKQVKLYQLTKNTTEAITVINKIINVNQNSGFLEYLKLRSPFV